MRGPNPIEARRIVGATAWLAGLTVGLWTFVFIMSAVRLVKTGHASAFVVLMGVGSLLQVASAPVRPSSARRWLRSSGLAAIAVAAYLLFRGVR
jgi:hypothetical protein